MKHSETSSPVYLFVLPWSPTHVGGVNQVVINLAREMKAHRSFEPVILVTDWGAREPIWEMVEGIRIVRWQVRGPVSGMAPKARLGKWLWGRRFGPAFEAFCREYRVVVVNPHFPTAAALTLASLVRRFQMRPRFLVSMHGADVSGLQTAARQTLGHWQRMLKECDGVVACSSALAERVHDVFGLFPNVIHNGIDADAFVRMAGPASHGPRRVLLSVGKFEPKKGQDVLLQAFSILVKRYPDLDLWLVGARDRTLEPLMQQAEELGLALRVRFLPDVPHAEVAQLFAQATIFVLPSRQEPFGIVVLEAGCLALPVVASAVGGVPEILQDGTTGRLVRPDDPAELVKAIQLLLDNTSEAKSMGERLRDHVMKNFSWTRAHQLYLGLAKP